MSLPNYQFTIISPYTGEVKKIYDGAAIYEAIYNRPLNDVGALVFTLSGEDTDLDEIFSLDTLIDVLRTDPLTNQFRVEDTYLVRLNHRFREGEEQRYVVGAMSLNHLIARRVIDPDDDPTAAGGYSTKAGSADEVMRAYAREQMGDLASTDRQFPNFSVGGILGVGASVGKRARYDNLLAVFQELAVQGAMDFITIRVTSNTLRLTIEPIGSNKTKTRNYPFSPFVMFNPMRGNLENPSFLIDRKQEANVVYALGQGQGEFRVTSIVPGQGVADSPYNRIEFTEDIRLAERGDTLQLSTGAQNALKDKRLKQEFSFDISGNAPGATYRLDWDVGDIVTAAWETVSVDLRIKDVEVSISESGEKISLVTETV